MPITSTTLKDWMPGTAPASLAKAGAVLVFGKDEGGIAALALDLALSSGSPVRVKVDDLTSQKLNSLVNTGSLFGAPDPVLIADVKDTHVKIFEPIVGDNDAPIVIMAGDLKKTSKLVKLFDEKGKAVQIFALEGAGTVDWLRKSLDSLGFGLDKEAARLAQGVLSGNRMEIIRLAEVLSLSAQGRGENTVTESDMRAIVPDLSDIDLGGALDAAITGDLTKALSRLDRQLASGENPITLFRLWGYRLGRLDALASTGESPKTAVSKARPPIFWKDKGFFETALKKLGPKGIGTLITSLDRAEQATVESGQSARVLAERLLAQAAHYKG